MKPSKYITIKGGYYKPKEVIEGNYKQGTLLFYTFDVLTKAVNGTYKLHTGGYLDGITFNDESKLKFKKDDVVILGDLV